MALNSQFRFHHNFTHQLLACVGLCHCHISFISLYFVCLHSAMYCICTIFYSAVVQLPAVKNWNNGW